MLSVKQKTCGQIYVYKINALVEEMHTSIGRHFHALKKIFFYSQARKIRNREVLPYAASLSK